jgi:hypothetical protein
MNRTRAYLRHHRARIIARRRRQFARWVGEYDHGPCDENGHFDNNWRECPRPLDVREAEYWQGRRLGMLSKWNGACTCWICASRKYRLYRAKRKREWHNESPLFLAEEGAFFISS